MARRHTRHASLLTLTALLALAATAAAADPSYPLCWWSGLPPAKPNVTVTRCLDASEYTCCADCEDRKYALVEASIDGRVLLNQVAPGLGDKFTNTNMMMCSVFSGFIPCQYHLEQFACATGCSPDSGTYFVKQDGQHVMQVCNDYSQQVYADCKGLSLPGVATLDRFFPTAQRFMEDLFGKVGEAFGVYNFSVAVVPGTDKCYNGPKKLPTLPVCCDPLPVPVESCPKAVMNFTEFPTMQDYINRTVTDPSCQNVPSDPMAPAPVVCGNGTADGGSVSSKAAADGANGTALVGCVNPTSAGNGTAAPPAPSAAGRNTMAYSVAVSLVLLGMTLVMG